MRDILITLFVLGMLPVCLIRPWIGVLMFSWLSYMNPHRLTWGFAYDFPFAQLVALATLAGMFFERDYKHFPMNGTVIVWLLMLTWMVFTTLFALNPPDAMDGLIKMTKIQMMIFVSLYLMGTKERMNLLVWVIALSIGFFGVKGGIFGILTGGQYRVWGPEGSFIQDNNSLALAQIMTLPLLRYLQIEAKSRYVSLGLLCCIGLLVVSILSSQSRGAFLGVIAMTGFLWLKSNHKVLTGLVLVLVAPIAFLSMPQSWHDRMNTIENYEEDGSAMGRITAWHQSYRLANARITAGGFRGIETEIGYSKYSPDLYAEILSTHGQFRAAHSIWFGMLGQHGWIGLGLFVLLGAMAWFNGSWVIRKSGNDPNLQWCKNLAGMLQVSLVGYAATGTFLSLEYFDYYYHIITLLVLLSTYTKRELAAVTDK